MWEDCFLHGGTATAAIALARTERLRVGVGLFPVPLRNAALVAMEIASLARLFPGQFLPVLGHGVLDWMGQVGHRADSPLTLLAEYTTAVRELLAGRQVDVDGRHVRLDQVALDHPPSVVPPVLVGGRGPRTLRLAGERADGVLLDHGSTPAEVRTNLATVDEGRPGPDFRRTGYVRAPATVGEVPDTIRAYADAGLDSVVLVPPADDPDPHPWLAALAG